MLVDALVAQCLVALVGQLPQFGQFILRKLVPRIIFVSSATSQWDLFEVPISDLPKLLVFNLLQHQHQLVAVDA